MVKIRNLICTLLAVGILLTTAYIPTAFASSVSDLQQQQQQAQQAQDSLEEKKQALQEALAGLDSDLQEVSAQMNELEEEIADCNAAIEQTQADLEEAQDNADLQYEQMKLRIQFMYENSTDSLLMTLLQADSFTDFLNRASYISEITTYDRERLDDYEATMDAIAQYESDLEDQYAQLLAAQDALADKQEELMAAIADRQQEIADTNQSIADQQQVLADLSDRIAAMQAYEEELERQKAQQEAERIAKEKAQKEAEEAAQKAAQEETTKKETAQETTGKDTSVSGSTTVSGSSSGNEGSGSSSGNESTGSNSDSTSGSTTAATQADASETELLAAIIYCEAGNESYEAQVAVGTVVMNRVSSPLFPNTITGVIYQSGQFTPAASGRLALALENDLATDSCRKAAQAVLAGTRSGSWLYFCVDYGTIDGTVIGSQVFY